MKISNLIAKGDAIMPRLKAAGKKQVLQELSAQADRLYGLEAQVVFETLLQREKLGSTGLGQGIAIPHGKFAALDRVQGIFARLTRPIDFEADDNRPVDLVFLLLAPEDAGADHLKALARVSRLLRDGELLEKLRGADTATALYAILTGSSLSSPKAA